MASRANFIIRTTSHRDKSTTFVRRRLLMEKSLKYSSVKKHTLHTHSCITQLLISIQEPFMKVMFHMQIYVLVDIAFTYSPSASKNFPEEITEGL